MLALALLMSRDRFDPFKLLSTNDIETVVGSGCPNLLRKALYSAKRLQARVQLDEGNVCSTCNLRGSCDGACVILKESEVAARTMDILPILLSYALDPLVISGGEKPPGREHIDFHSCKLVMLANCKCNFLNFSKNLQCLKCKEDGPKNVGGVETEMMEIESALSKCNFMNFSRNVWCLRCKAEGPKKVRMNAVQMKKGDWIIGTAQRFPVNHITNLLVGLMENLVIMLYENVHSSPYALKILKCGFMNFASNRKCLRCQEARPERQCDFLNYRRNQVCLKCKHERTEKLITEYDKHTWKRPFQSSKKGRCLFTEKITKFLRNLIVPNMNLGQFSRFYKADLCDCDGTGHDDTKAGLTAATASLGVGSRMMFVVIRCLC
ncbi:zinc finger protein VAR3, chloroplastic-like [Durio zibethinus]|uniref:Zinc finger protein VAR3, chloroplastic-like n=1 Tax=Durio zibethinus TaxID=66656 RepID=A0A6P5ZRI6_DURZI|nr:zinc finger protein VAR3, chloroplastic-like [Durio zibethinus]